MNLNGMKRTHMCGSLREENIGETVTIMGWVQKRRDLGNLIFIDLRDRSGICQITFDSETKDEIFTLASGLRNEYVIAVTGIVNKRSSVNTKIPTGMVEIAAEELKILSKAQTTPFVIEDDSDVNEVLKLKYRYLDLRRPSMTNNMVFRHKVTKIARDFFDENGYIEIETPVLTKSTPEGARDYLVPSRVHPGKFYALPQSPQIYKQLLMMSGMDRYFQIVKCFRDEDLRADRQPEFTQIDEELSFVDVDDVITINEKLIQRIFKETLSIDIQLPLTRMPYEEAMNRYGSDKPDTRFGLELCDISDCVKDCGFKVFTDAVANGGSVRLINVQGGASKFSRKEIDALTETVKLFKAKGLAWMKFNDDVVQSPIAKFLNEDEINAIKDKANAKSGDLLLIVADKNTVVYDALGNLRLEVAKKMDIIDNDKFNLLWVTEFPLFEYNEDENRYVAKHHPFTSPMDEDLELIETNPEKVRAKAYDIVLNGIEVGGGSIRIHDTDLQEKMFKALGFTTEDAWSRFGHLMEAFKYGTPPHGGMAFGLDRLVMLLLKKDSIRDVIAFPKVQNASELMTNAPDVVDDKQMKDLSLKLDIAKNS